MCSPFVCTHIGQLAITKPIYVRFQSFKVVFISTLAHESIELLKQYIRGLQKVLPRGKVQT